MYWNNLGVRLGDEFPRTEAMADLGEPICTTQGAVKATPDDLSSLAMYCNNLVLRLGDRFSHTGAMADL